MATQQQAMISDMMDFLRENADVGYQMKFKAPTNPHIPLVCMMRVSDEEAASEGGVMWPPRGRFAEVRGAENNPEVIEVVFDEDMLKSNQALIGSYTSRNLQQACQFVLDYLCFGIKPGMPSLPALLN